MDMLTENHYHNSILLLLYLIVNVDGVLDIEEKVGIQKICEYENLPQNKLLDFVAKIHNYSEKEIFNLGMEEISHCTDEEKIKVFAWLHRISEADGYVHVKEIRFLMYSIKRAGMEFDHVIKAAANFPSLI